MERLIVKMAFCKGTKNLTFRVDSKDGLHQQVLWGDGYQWDGDSLIVLSRGKVSFTFSNAILC